MECDNCGKQIPLGERPIAITTEVDPTAGSMVYGEMTRTKSVTLCRSCAIRRDVTERSWWWGLALIIGGLLAVTILLALWRNPEWLS